MIDLMIKDRYISNGIFFIDPHGDAIDKLLKHLSSLSLQDTILLDPEDPHYSFGINLLECGNIADINARNDTFNRAKGVFDKLWKDTFEAKPWLQLVLQNTIYAFIENPGYTLAEFPYFYWIPGLEKQLPVICAITMLLKSTGLILGIGQNASRKSN